MDGRDILRKEDVSGYDAGFKQLAVGDISGRIWIDHNYDGMQDEADDAANTAEDKAAIANVTVKAIQYYYDGSQWRIQPAQSQMQTANTHWRICPPG